MCSPCAHELPAKKNKQRQSGRKENCVSAGHSNSIDHLKTEAPHKGKLRKLRMGLARPKLQEVIERNSESRACICRACGVLHPAHALAMLDMQLRIWSRACTGEGPSEARPWHDKHGRMPTCGADPPPYRSTTRSSKQACQCKPTPKETKPPR